MTDDRVTTLMLQEFRLSAVDTDGAVARIVSELPAGLEPAVPLLTSIDDPHDVAMIRVLRDGESDGLDVIERAGVDPFISSWQPTRHYDARIVESSQSPPTHYRLAVTESGINDEARAPSSARPRGGALNEASASVSLLWIGRPHGSHGGLLILLGDDGDPEAARSDPHEWPLPMSRGLGVRIYDSAA
ncbi:MAG TPA: hypothetical protein VFV20_06425 [Candidatus Limnocylindria bacterium]|nr:hypothetical protein [Candidatus Limnocylindria bacterium]